MEHTKYTLEDLKAHAYVIQEEEAVHQFTGPEMIAMKDQLFELSKTKMFRENVLKTITDALKNDCDENALTSVLSEIDTSELGDVGIKTLSKNFTQLLSKINKGYESVKKTLYGIDDQEAEMMTFYDEDSNIIYSRPLFPTEKQTKITSLHSKIS